MAKTINYKYLFIHYRDDGIDKEVYLDINTSPDEAADKLITFVKEAVGERLTDEHITTIHKKWRDNCSKLIEINLRTGISSFERITFSDESDIMPYITISKETRKRKAV